VRILLAVLAALVICIAVSAPFVAMNYYMKLYHE